jgi:ADP-heptose:LPS heptosyltransferase
LDTHITTQWQRELEEQGLPFQKDSHDNHGSSTLSVPDEVRERGRRELATIGVVGQAVLVHSGSGGRAKCWPLGCFLEVAGRLRAGGLEVCFVTGPAEIERWSADELEAIRGEFPSLESPGPDELLSVLAAARTLVSNDAGPAHLAALLGTPTVTIFGPSSAKVWRPLGRQAHVIVGDPDSRPLDWGIDPQQVVDAALACLRAVRS